MDEPMPETITSKAAPAKLRRSEIEARALEILRAHGVGALPVDPVTLANREGIKVHNAKFSDESLSGMVAKRGQDVTILVNQSDPPFRKRFTIAHELGHIYLHLCSDGDFIDTETDMFRETGETTEDLSPEKLMEVQANQFAAAILMPSDTVKSYFETHPRVSDLARLFNVSEEAMGFRLNRLGLT